MAAAPVRPADFKALISDPTATMCGNFVNTLLKLPVLLYKLVNFWLDDAGNPTSAMVNSVLPPGFIVPSACTQAEGKWLLCDGREVDRTTYANLYAAIGLTYGTPSGSSVFKIPDLRGMATVGLGTGTDVNGGTKNFALGVKEGAYAHTLTEDELPVIDITDGTHKYALIAPYAGSVTGSDTVNSGSEQAVGAGDSGPLRKFGSGAAHTNVQPSLGLYYYIVV